MSKFIPIDEEEILLLIVFMFFSQAIFDGIYEWIGFFMTLLFWGIMIVMIRISLLNRARCKI